MTVDEAMTEHDESAALLRATALEYHRTRDALSESELQRAALDYAYACVLLAKVGAL
jgi:hypothetical protein